MVSVENLKVEFGVTPLFDEVSFVINPHDRVALLGKNGAGKTTLLRILCGEQQPSAGVVSFQQGMVVGYLPQIMNLSDGRTVLEETEHAFEGLFKVKAEIERTNEELARRTDYDSPGYEQLIARFSHLNDQYELMGGSNYHAELERTLVGLGFQRTDLDRPTAEFSGGWRMRIELAKLLLRHPDLLLLDEPTNHLDIESISWLEAFLKNSPGAVVLVSHDKAFVNAVTNRTMEISCHRLHDYKVAFNEYVVLRKERREQQLRAYANQQRQIQETENFIERFRYKATKAVQVQSRIRQLEKIVPIEIDEVDNSQLHLKFAPPQRSGNFPVICHDVGKCYDGHRIFGQVNLSIRRGEKVAFVGRNGEGKSTLVKCIMNQIAFEGSIELAHGVQIGYFAQNQAQLLDPELTVFDTVDFAATGDMRLKVRDILGAFMFGGEASEKKVKVLSGGERSRLAMIRLLLEPANLLILDEPTNHLDMASKDVLKDALREFEGTVVVVSHDRDFLDGLVDKVYEFADGKVREHIGGIFDFLRLKQWGVWHQAEGKERQEKVASTNARTVSPATSVGKADYAIQKEQQRKLRKIQKDIDECEQQIAQLEALLARTEQIMATPEGAADPSLYTCHADLTKQLDAAMARWEQLSTELETCEASTKK